MKTTIVIVTFKSTIIHKCIKSLSKKFKIIVVENSNNIKFKRNIESKYKNTRCILSGSNLGYARANNIGLKKVKTKYALIINPDVIISTEQIRKFESYAKINEKFSILGPNSNGFIETVTSSFDRKSIKKKKYFNFIKNLIKNKKIFEIDFIPGWCMFLNMKEAKRINYFDKNFFLYFEDKDICKSFEKKNKKMFVLSYIKIHHIFGSSVDTNEKNRLYNFRDWHLYWSSFYYHRKHYGFFSSLLIHFSKLIRFFLLKNFYIIINNKNLYELYKARLSGLVSQILNRTAFSSIISKID